jgi:hypothetical protein
MSPGMKTLLLRFTVPVEVEVPDDFPVSREAIEASADWLANDYRDGRYPHSVEDMHHAALGLARSSMSSAISNHYSDRMEARFGRQHLGEMSYELRNALAERCEKKLGYYRVTDGGGIEIAVASHPLGPKSYGYQQHVVVCRDDAKDDGSLGDYKLATRTVFEGREAAEAYAATIAPSRDPLVIPVRLDELRVGEDRGRLDYWRAP